MRILIDECLPRFLKKSLPGHFVMTAQDCGWTGIKNGQLLLLAEKEFDVFLTGDKNLRYQQNLVERKIAIIEFPVNSRVAVRQLVPQLIKVLETLSAGTYVQLSLA